MRTPSQRRVRLDQTIEILAQAAGVNALNESTGAWAPSFSTRAKVYQTPGFEKSVGDRKVAVIPLTFEVRPDQRTLAILPSQKVRWKGTDYNIIAPIHQPSRGANIQIICAAGK